MHEIADTVSVPYRLMVLVCCVYEQQDDWLFVECALRCLDKHVVGWIHVIPGIGDRDIRKNPDVFNVGAVRLALEELGNPQHRAILKVVGVEIFAITSGGFTDNRNRTEVSESCCEHFGGTSGIATRQYCNGEVVKWW